MSGELAARVKDGMSQAQADLEALVRIPSVAFEGFPEEPNLAAAELTAELLRGVLDDVEIVEVPGAPPTVLGRAPAPPGAPTVLLYAHYDVQPAGPEEAWTSPAFEPSVRDGRLYGRGAADDKSGVIMHVAALRALTGELAVGVTVVIEGDEETGRGTFDGYLAAHPEELAADVIVVADSGNWKLGEPTLCASLRGLTELVVEVSTLERPAHSGLVGGAAPDALLALIRMLDALTDEHGDVAVAGLVRRDWDGMDMPEDALRGTASVLDGVELVGTGSIAERLYSRPAITVIGLDAPAVATAANALVPVVRAKVSVRLAPGDDPARAFGLVRDHLEAATPWDVRVSITEGAGAPGFAVEGNGPGLAAARRALAEAYGKASVDVGSGGSIPLVTTLAATYPEAEIVVWGAQDDGARIHAGDEGVVLEELGRAVLAEALLLRELARR
ncbi:MAG: M20/M25/M40 family metallo-hydrolase [Solirubrobacterales bacterium]|nr:M20/M25/M40 family metallo-hydrolase [Solirubrobacterales bacterium]